MKVQVKFNVSSPVDPTVVVDETKEDNIHPLLAPKTQTKLFTILRKPNQSLKDLISRHPSKHLPIRRLNACGDTKMHTLNKITITCSQSRRCIHYRNSITWFIHPKNREWGTSTPWCIYPFQKRIGTPSLSTIPQPTEALARNICCIWVRIRMCRRPWLGGNASWPLGNSVNEIDGEYIANQWAIQASSRLWRMDAALPLSSNNRYRCRDDQSRLVRQGQRLLRSLVVVWLVLVPSLGQHNRASRKRIRILRH